MTYQWYKNGVAITNGGRISGATSSSLNITSTVSSDSGKYSCHISGICSPVAISDTVKMTVSTCTAITPADFNNQTIVIYPNPTSTTSTIEFKNQNQQEAVVLIYDGLGALAAQAKYFITSDLEQFILPMDNLAQGMYYIQIQLGEGYYTYKIERIP